MKKECVTMLLAGGVGKRLGLLTKNLAKPAVPFGGRYRIIDFTLSNCLNSRMYTVGVLTQYSPFVLHKHIGVGKPWDLDRLEDGLAILSPYTENDGGNWYLGTADAITKNMKFIERYQPEYLVVLSGDHIYHMDYDKLLQYHKDQKADVTIAALEIPLNEASRFGIVNTDENLKIYQFEEKPKEPKNNLASMGIYIFNWTLLKEYLEADMVNPASQHDFGHDIIPTMLANQCSMYAYRFTGYWKDVGTIQSYWEAHMDLLEDDIPFSLNNDDWRIYSHDSNFAPQLIEEGASIKQSLINNGCMIAGDVQQSVLFENVRIGTDTTVDQSILLPGGRIGDNVTLKRVIVQENVIIPDHTTIISLPDEEPIVISNENIDVISVNRGVAP
ncbi:glucose-1-phosphate adenylyltransferase [Gracilibacillus salinarum]|uniref:Glucose-1-phosphate adenylyltransferase n=1 Tax=Gracilibacillus salinarum TaxID=2932255 RepID=A0ABY4GPS6_9BACI|nr:glucose-1-phosphate adenylyltransferase [Gracilibacillus salinarum]UOQ86191.1 glucose-1-phosphate adenylyltransferase [Gracilibacillus salinarum]